MILKSMTDMLKDDKDVEFKNVLTPKSLVSSLKFKKMILPVGLELNM